LLSKQQEIYVMVITANLRRGSGKYGHEFFEKDVLRIDFI